MAELYWLENIPVFVVSLNSWASLCSDIFIFRALINVFEWVNHKFSTLGNILDLDETREISLIWDKIVKIWTMIEVACTLDFFDEA